MTPKKYYVQSYGCQMNTTESQEMAGICQKLGLEETDNYQKADVIILNSCSVRQAAEDKVYGWGKKVTKQGYGQFINEQEQKTPPTQPLNNAKKSPDNWPLMILTGCMVGSSRGSRHRITQKELKKRANFVDYFIDQGQYEEQLPYILLREGLVETSNFTTFAPMSAAFNATRPSGNQAYVKISEGCDNFCTFCVVPYSRGPEKHKSEEQILAEIHHLLQQGFNDIMLLGQNVNSWGITSKKQKMDIRINSEQKLPFAALLRRIHAIKNIKKIRFITSNPFDFTKDMVQTLALPKIDRLLHMAVQSGSNTVLRRMNRRHTIEEFLQLLQNIRQTVPDIQIGTDLIVGFCGETEEEFQETLKLIKTAQFDFAYSAMYSTRPGTLAQKKYQDNIPLKVKKERYQILVNHLQKIKKSA